MGIHTPTGVDNNSQASGKFVMYETFIQARRKTTKSMAKTIFLQDIQVIEITIN